MTIFHILEMGGNLECLRSTLYIVEANWIIDEAIMSCNIIYPFKGRNYQSAWIYIKKQK